MGMEINVIATDAFPADRKEAFGTRKDKTFMEVLEMDAADAMALADSQTVVLSFFPPRHKSVSAMAVAARKARVAAMVYWGERTASGGMGDLDFFDEMLKRWAPFPDRCYQAEICTTLRSVPEYVMVYRPLGEDECFRRRMDLLAQHPPLPKSPEELVQRADGEPDHIEVAIVTFKAGDATHDSLAAVHPNGPRPTPDPVALTQLVTMDHAPPEDCRSFELEAGLVLVTDTFWKKNGTREVRGTLMSVDDPLPPVPEWGLWSPLAQEGSRVVIVFDSDGMSKWLARHPVMGRPESAVRVCYASDVQGPTHLHLWSSEEHRKCQELVERAGRPDYLR